MCSVYDQDALIVADQFYMHLLKSGDVPDGKSVEALHHVVQHLRRESPRFMLWLPFIHIGV